MPKGRLAKGLVLLVGFLFHSICNSNPLLMHYLHYPRSHSGAGGGGFGRGESKVQVVAEVDLT